MKSVRSHTNTRWVLIAMCATIMMVAPLSAWAQDAKPADTKPADTKPTGDTKTPEATKPDGQNTPPKTTPVGPRQKVLILPTAAVKEQVTSIVPERIDDMARKKIKEEQKLTLLPSFADIRKQLAGKGQASAAVYQAEQLYAQGIGLITAGENQQATQKFQQAVKMMEENIVDLQNYNVLKDALSNLALAYFLTGYDLDARKRMKEFAHLNQKAKLNAEKFPKDLIKVYTSEVAKIAKLGPGKLVVKSNIKNAKIYVDGVDKGVAPATLTDITAGFHHIILRGPNGEVWSKKFRVRGKGKEQTVDAQLVKKATAVAASKKADELPDYYKDLIKKLNSGTFTKSELDAYLAELAKQSGAAYISWVLLFKQGSEYIAAPFVYKAQGGQLVGLDRTKFNFELSNLTIGVNEIVTRVTTSVANLPADKAVTSVALIKPVEVKTPIKSPVVIVKKDDKKDNGKTGAIVTPPTKITPLPPATDGGSSTWTYVGLGAAGVVLVGLVAGSVYLLSGDDGNQQPSSFKAEVSW